MIMQKSKLEWERYQPYDSAPRLGWKLRAGKLTIRVYEKFRLTPDGERRWTGRLSGCKAYVELLWGLGITDGSEAKERALYEFDELINLGNGC